jgi:RimJ/RimL family protein N-acetyltransferase
MGSSGTALIGALEHAAPSAGIRRMSASRPWLIHARLQLRDGRCVRIRAIGAADAELLRQFDAGLSETSRRLRYLGWMPPLSAEEAARWATVDFRDRFALVAVAGKGERKRIVADCRLVPFPERPGSLEVAIAVADDFQGAGLGRALLQLILGIAAARRVEVLARVHYDNQRMMHLLLELGFRRTEWELGVVTFVASCGGPQAEVSSTSRSRAEIIPTTF